MRVRRYMSKLSDTRRSRAAWVRYAFVSAAILFSFHTNRAWAAEEPTTFFGDMWGVRPFLEDHGMTLTIQETSEVLGNISGGTRQGFAYDGLTTATLQLDTQKAFGHPGGTFNISGLQIHGSNLSETNLLSLQTASGIQSRRATRLWELWYEQKFMPEDKLSVRIGQQSIDQEFMTSTNGALFVNTMFGWPMLPSANMPGGGPAYPLSALGVRVRAQLTDSVTMLAGIYNGNPAKDYRDDAQIRNPHGLSFPLNGGVLAIAELQYTTQPPDASGKEGGAQALPGIYKLGMWYNSEPFHDVRYDTAGLSLANPISSGEPRVHRGNYSFYALADKMVYRFEDNPDRNINLFVRAMIAPQQDRNLIRFSVNGGLTFHGLIPNRDKDTFGLGLGFAQVTSGVSGFDRDTGFYNPGMFAPVRSHETFIEATYQYQATPWLQIQPDFQYIFRPGAGIVNPYNPTQRIKNEAVLGVRTNILF